MMPLNVSSIWRESATNMSRPKPNEYTRTLIDNNLHNLIVRLDATKSAIKSLELKEKELIAMVKADIQDIECDHLTIEAEGFTAGMYPSYTVTLSEGGRSTIDREKLLERGVDPEIIAYATNKSEYTTLRIKENKADIALKPKATRRRK